MRLVIDKVGLAVLRLGRLLLVRNVGTEKLLLPGGRRETGESDETTLSREIREELNCRLLTETIEFLGSYSDRAVNDPGSIVTIRLYRGIIDGEPVASSEIAEIVWFDLSLDDRSRLSPIIQRKILPTLGL